MEKLKTINKFSFIGEFVYKFVILLLWYIFMPIAIALTVIELNNPLLAFGSTGMGVLFGIAISKDFIKNDSKTKSILVGLMYTVLVIICCTFEYTTNFFNNIIFESFIPNII